MPIKYPFTLSISKHEFITSFAIYSFLAAAILGVQFVGLRYFGVDDLGIPFAFTGDALHHLAVAKAIVDQGWWWHIDRLGAPFGLDMYLFPVESLLDNIALWVLSHFSQNPVVIVNAYWLGSFALSGLAACWSFRRLGLSRLIAFVGGVLYAFLPGAYFRGIGHLMLVYYTVPPSIAMCILLLKNEWHLLRRVDQFIFWGALSLLGLGYIYYSFFACLALFLTLVLLLSQGNVQRHNSILSIKAIALIATIAALQLTPAVIGWKYDPEAKENINQKSVSEADIYGLKLRHLLTPTPDNPAPFLRHISSNFSGAGFPLENENTNARLGFVGSVGFLLLIGLGLFRLVDQRLVFGLTKDLGSAAALNIWFVLFATIGGLGSVFNLIVSPDIRTYNRVSPFIAFLSLYAVCSLFAILKAKLAAGGTRNLWFNALCVLITTLGVGDEAMFSYTAQHWKNDRGLYTTTRDFISQLEKLLPSNAMIFQLPDTMYPNASNSFDMVAHQNLGSYVVSHSVKFSWPALSSKALNFHQSISTRVADPKDLAESLSIIGYSGILIDRFGLENRGSSLIEQLREIGVESQLESDDGRFAYLSLEKVGRRLSSTLNPTELRLAKEHLLSVTISKPEGPLPSTGFRSMIEISGVPTKAHTGAQIHMRVAIKNLGDSVWHAGGIGPNTIRLSYCWINSQQSEEAHFNNRFLLPRDINPEGIVDVPIAVKAPDSPGQYFLEVDLVQEGVAWFSQRGNVLARQSIAVGNQ